MLSRQHGGDARPGEDVSGHSLWLGGSSATLAPTLVRLSSSHPGVPEGEPVALAAEVITLGGGPTATGEVTFLVDGQPVGAAVLDEAGQASLSGLRLPVGVHAVLASYAGDREHAAATSAALPQAVTAPAAPVVVLVAAPVTTPQGVVIEAEVVDPRSGRLADDAAGSLSFVVGRTELGTAQLRAGLARLVVPTLPPGRLRVCFPGDREHAPAEGSLPREALAEPYPERS